MAKIAVIYKSKYGWAKIYAEWIAQDLGADLIEVSAVKPADLAGYDCVVYGGGLYAGSIAGVKAVLKANCKNLAVFSVGLADPATAKYDININAKLFHLRGGIDYSKLNLAHKGIMAVLNKTISAKPESDWTSEDRGIRETYGGCVDFTDRASITSIIDYVKEVLR